MNDYLSQLFGELIHCYLLKNKNRIISMKFVTLYC